MKSKLIQTKDYLLLIDEESRGIAFGEVGVNMRHSKLEVETRNIGGYGSDKYYWSHKKCLAYYPLTEEAKELDLPLLPVTPKDEWGVHETHCCEEHGCKYGDNDCCVAIGIAKAKYPCEYCYDDEDDMQFTLKDVKKAFIAGQKHEEDIACSAEINLNPNLEEYIQSLSTQQLPKEFIPEYERVRDWDSRDVNGDYNSKLQLKTTTNSEGKEELVGTWKF